MEDKEFTDIISLITKQTGIIPRESHKSGIKNFIDKRKKEIKLNGLDYYNYVCLNKAEMDILLNHATVNETYFFREESQFNFLKNKVLPELHSSLGLNPVRIWSAAASSGEEIYSLYLLALSLGIKTEAFASDINTCVLEKCAKGQYSPASLKKTDGTKFHYLLSNYQKVDKSVDFSPEFCKKIEKLQINLSDENANFPKNQHIIFMRNVFIYFTTEMRRQILEKIVNESLCDGGYLFLSMSEIASIDSSILPKNLKKCSDGKVFYFQKK